MEFGLLTINPTEIKMKVIYPGSFNPWTIGHQDIYDRAKAIFGEVVVVIAFNPSKNVNCSFIEWTLEPLKMNVEVDYGLIAESSDIIIRGVRSGDWEYEQNLAQWNRVIGAETIFLSPSPAVSHINSSAVRLLTVKNPELASQYFSSGLVYERWTSGEVGWGLAKVKPD